MDKTTPAPVFNYAYAPWVSFNAFASWSGQEVGFMPHWMPSRRAITSETS